MKILLVASTVSEIDSTLHFLNKFSIEGVLIESLITGVGMVNTTYHLSEKIRVFKPEFCIQAGIAGSFTNKFSIGDVANVIHDVFSELGAEDGDDFITAKDLGLVPEISVKNDLTYTRFFNFFASLPTAKGITVNTVHGSTFSITKIVQRLQPEVESMEGAAFLYVCNLEKIPCVQIRSISNVVERRKRENWNIPLAINQLNTYLIKFFKSLK